MRLVGALATIFLFRGKSKQKRVFEERQKGQGSWVEWCRKQKQKTSLNSPWVTSSSTVG